MSTLMKDISLKSNDYSKEEIEFVSNVGIDFNFGEGRKQDIKKIKLRVSIVIPAYVGKNLPFVLRCLEEQLFKEFEVIIVDDCSPVIIQNVVLGLNVSYPIKIIRNTKNKGRSVARNIGIAIAEGDVIITMDQDMMVRPDFVLNFALRQELTQNCVFLGFRENIDFEEYHADKKADYKKDWRYELIDDEKFIMLSPNRERPKYKKNKAYRLFEETNKFKNFGMGKRVGCWDLASTVISHSLCFKRSAIIEAGGFPEIFTGWGVEDLATGASLIAHGNYIVPLPACSSYHINHKRFSGSRKIEWGEFLNNLNIYFNFINTTIDAIKFNYHKTEKVTIIEM